MVLIKPEPILAFLNVYTRLVCSSVIWMVMLQIGAAIYVYTHRVAIDLYSIKVYNFWYKSTCLGEEIFNTHNIILNGTTVSPLKGRPPGLHVCLWLYSNMPFQANDCNPHVI